MVFGVHWSPMSSVASTKFLSKAACLHLRLETRLYSVSLALSDVRSGGARGVSEAI
jgi:hypothetical protein